MTLAKRSLKITVTSSSTGNLLASFTESFSSIGDLKFHIRNRFAKGKKVSVSVIDNNDNGFFLSFNVICG